MAKEDLVPVNGVAVDISSTDFDCFAALGGSALRIFVGTGGTVYVKFVGQSVAVAYVMPTGSYLSGRINTVVRASTTASNMVAER